MPRKREEQQQLRECVWLRDSGGRLRCATGSRWTKHWRECRRGTTVGLRRRLGPTAARKLATIVDASIRAAIGLRVECSAAGRRAPLPARDQPDSFPYGLAEKEFESRDVGELWKRDAESDEAFEEWQRRRHEVFDAFTKKLNAANARVVVDDITREEFEAIANADTDSADRWYRLFLNLDAGARRTVHNLVLDAGICAAQTIPAANGCIAQVVSGENPPIRFTEGRARVPLEAMVAWSAADSDTPVVSGAMSG